jgi:hypothetical protein
MDQFLPVYKEIYGFLQMQTLPHFLSYAQTNINLPKQVFWSVSCLRPSCYDIVLC